MAITKLSNSGYGSAMTKYDSLLAGNAAFIPTSYDSISTVTVGAGGTSTITFSSIPSTYQHLQIRAFAGNNTNVGNSTTIYFNSDTTNSNYNCHRLDGTGATISSGVETSPYAFWYPGSATYPSSTIIDILDYTNTNKNKTVRVLAGYDANGSGNVNMMSVLWRNTSAINTITIPSYSTSKWAQYSHFALYGIKGA